MFSKDNDYYSFIDAELKIYIGFSCLYVDSQQESISDFTEVQ